MVKYIYVACAMICVDASTVWTAPAQSMLYILPHTSMSWDSWSGLAVCLENKTDDPGYVGFSQDEAKNMIVLMTKNMTHCEKKLPPIACVGDEKECAPQY